MERNKVRTNIYLLPRQVARLEAESDKVGSSMAELIRRAIDSVYPDVTTKRSAKNKKLF